MNLENNRESVREITSQLGTYVGQRLGVASPGDQLLGGHEVDVGQSQDGVRLGEVFGLYVL